MSAPITIAQRLKIPRVLWGALLVSQLLYVGMLAAGIFGADHKDGPEGDLLAPFVVAAAGMALISLWLPAQLRRSAIGKLKLALTEIPDPDAPIGFRGAAPMIRAYAEPAKVIAQAIPLGFTPYLLSLALAESVSVFGLVLGVLGHGPEVWSGFFAAGITLTAIRFPTADTFLRPIEEHTGVPLPR